MSNIEFNDITCSYSGRELKVYSNGKLLPIHQRELIPLLVKAMQELNQTGRISDIKIQEYDDTVVMNKVEELGKSNDIKMENIAHKQKELEIKVDYIIKVLDEESTDEFLALKKEKDRIVARLLALESRMKM